MKKKTRDRIDTLTAEAATLARQKKASDEHLNGLRDTVTAQRIQAIEAGFIPFDIVYNITEEWQAGHRPLITLEIYGTPTEVTAIRQAAHKKRAHT